MINIDQLKYNFEKTIIEWLNGCYCSNDKKCYRIDILDIHSNIILYYYQKKQYRLSDMFITRYNSMELCKLGYSAYMIETIVFKYFNLEKYGRN